MKKVISSLVFGGMCLSSQSFCAQDVFKNNASAKSQNSQNVAKKQVRKAGDSHRHHSHHKKGNSSRSKRQKNVGSLTNSLKSNLQNKALKLLQRIKTADVDLSLDNPSVLGAALLASGGTIAYFTVPGAREFFKQKAVDVGLSASPVANPSLWNTVLAHPVISTASAASITGLSTFGLVKFIQNRLGKSGKVKLQTLKDANDSFEKLNDLDGIKAAAENANAAGCTDLNQVNNALKDLQDLEKELLPIKSSLEKGIKSSTADVQSKKEAEDNLKTINELLNLVKDLKAKSNKLVAEAAARDSDAFRQKLNETKTNAEKAKKEDVKDFASVNNALTAVQNLIRELNQIKEFLSTKEGKSLETKLSNFVKNTKNLSKLEKDLTEKSKKIAVQDAITDSKKLSLNAFMERVNNANTEEAIKEAKDEANNLLNVIAGHKKALESHDVKALRKERNKQLNMLEDYRNTIQGQIGLLTKKSDDLSKQKELEGAIADYDNLNLKGIQQQVNNALAANTEDAIKAAQGGVSAQKTKLESIRKTIQNSKAYWPKEINMPEILERIGSNLKTLDELSNDLENCSLANLRNKADEVLENCKGVYDVLPKDSKDSLTNRSSKKISNAKERAKKALAKGFVVTTEKGQEFIIGVKNILQALDAAIGNLENLKMSSGLGSFDKLADKNAALYNELVEASEKIEQDLENLKELKELLSEKSERIGIYKSMLGTVSEALEGYDGRKLPKTIKQAANALENTGGDDIKETQKTVQDSLKNLKSVDEGKIQTVLNSYEDLAGDLEKKGATSEELEDLDKLKGRLEKAQKEIAQLKNLNSQISQLLSAGASSSSAANPIKYTEEKPEGDEPLKIENGGLSDDTVKRMKQLEADWNALKSEVSLVEQQATELKAKNVNDLDLKQLVDVINELSNQQTQLDEFVKKEGLSKDLSKDVSTKSNDLGRAKADLGRIVSERLNLLSVQINEKTKNLESAVDGPYDKMNDILSRSEGIDDQMTSEKEKLNALNGINLTDAEAQTVGLSEEVEKLKAQLNNVKNETEKAELQAKIENADNQINRLNEFKTGLNDAKNAVKEALKSKVSEKIQGLLEAAKSMQAFDPDNSNVDALNSLQQGLEKAEKEAADVQSVIKLLDESDADLQDRLNEATQQAKEAKKSAESFQAQLSEAKKQTKEDLKKAVKILRNAVETGNTSVDRVSDLATALESFDVKEFEEVAKLEGATKQAVDVATLEKQLQNDVEEAKKAKESVEKTQSELNNKLDETKGLVDDAFQKALDNEIKKKGEYLKGLNEALEKAKNALNLKKAEKAKEIFEELRKKQEAEKLVPVGVEPPVNSDNVKLIKDQKDQNDSGNGDSSN